MQFVSVSKATVDEMALQIKVSWAGFGLYKILSSKTFRFQCTHRTTNHLDGSLSYYNKPISRLDDVVHAPSHEYLCS
jgi:hypothetical protein